MSKFDISRVPGAQLFWWPSFRARWNCPGLRNTSTISWWTRNSRNEYVRHVLSHVCYSDRYQALNSREKRAWKTVYPTHYYYIIIYNYNYVSCARYFYIFSSHKMSWFFFYLHIYIYTLAFIPAEKRRGQRAQRDVADLQAH